MQQPCPHYQQLTAQLRSSRVYTPVVLSPPSQRGIGGNLERVLHVGLMRICQRCGSQMPRFIPLCNEPQFDMSYMQIRRDSTTWQVPGINSEATLGHRLQQQSSERTLSNPNV